ncbi:MAG: glutamine synthetase, partial [Thalassobaculaceae bacterium]
MPSDTRDIDAFRAAHPTITMIDVVIADNHGVPRGKRVPVDKLASVWRDGVLFPESVFSLDRTGDTVDAAGLGVTRGDIDHPCLPLPHTLAPVPWRDALGQVQVTMRGPDGAGFFADPRQVLKNVLGHFKRDGWQPVAAVEMEFYLLDAAPGPDGQPRPPRGEVSGRRATDVGVYSLDELNDHASCLTAMEAAARDQGLPLSAVVSENAPSQFEINLNHRDDPLRAADDAMLLKRLIKGVAHG